LESQITIHQLNQLIDYIKKTHTVYGTQLKDGKLVFDALNSSSDLKLGHKKPIIPFKKILFPNLLEPNATSVIPDPVGDPLIVDSRRMFTPINHRGGNDKVRGGNDKLEIGNNGNSSRSLHSSNKIALIGLNNCDVWALHYLLEEFTDTKILPKRENILIFSSECFPNENCFCDLTGTNKLAPFDLHVQEEKNEYAIFSGNKRGEAILKKNGIKQSQKKLQISEIKPNQKTFAEQNISKIIDNKEKHIEFWDKISENCFGCGACSTVCPLCFCTRQDFKNELTGESKQCLNWDSCFAKRFSEIQNHYDFRPKNVDRLYNWYHHKFVRSYHKNKRFLCTGCGRCIEACPAHLNMKNILESLIEQDSEKETKDEKQ